MRPPSNQILSAAQMRRAEEELIAAGTDIDYVGATAVEMVGSGESAGNFREYDVKDGKFETAKFR